jgi:uncharacterized protein YoxC
MTKMTILNNALRAFPDRRVAIALLQAEFDKVDEHTPSVEELNATVDSIEREIMRTCQNLAEMSSKFFVTHALLEYCMKVVETVNIGDTYDVVLEELEDLSQSVLNTAIADAYLKTAEGLLTNAQTPSVPQ